MRGYDLTSKPEALEVLQNAFILIYHCEIYPYVYFYSHVKADVLEAVIFYRIIFVNTMCLSF